MAASTPPLRGGAVLLAVVVFIALAGQAQASTFGGPFGGRVAILRTTSTCTCTATGAYVVPKASVTANPGTQTSSTTYTSPTGKYHVSTSTAGVPSGEMSIVVTLASNGQSVLGATGSAFGFGPKDLGFTVTSSNSSNGTFDTLLYNLAGANPQAPQEFSSGDYSGQSRIGFSPTGTHFLFARILPNTQTFLTVVDVATGAAPLSVTLDATNAPGSQGEKFGSVTWGFGPKDLAFIYAYIEPNSSVDWTLVNLTETSANQFSQTISDVSAYSQFSQCGDVVALVEGGGVNSTTADVNLFHTSDGSADGAASGAAPVSLATTQTEQQATFSGASQPTNLAPNECTSSGGGGTGAGLVANYTIPAGIRAGIPATFTDSSTDSDGTITSWSWDFGDGSTSSDENPTHTFATGGHYTVTLTVGDGTATATKSKTFFVAYNKPPTASFTWSPQTPARGDTVTFTDTSTDDDGIAEENWTVNGQGYSGSPISVHACSTLHVTLTVYDHAFQSDSKSARIELTTSGPQTIHVPAGGSLADAIAKACPGDTVALAQGTYTGGVTLDDVNLEGAGAGNTIVDGTSVDQPDWVLTLDNGHNPSKHVSLSDLSVRDGAGGVFLQGNNTRYDLRDIEVDHNTDDGGIFVDDNVTLVTVTGSALHDNHTTDSGGGFGMFCCGHVVMTGNQIYSNSADGDGGGAWPFENNSVVFTGNSVHDNTAGGAGGGLFLGDGFGATDRVLNNRFLRNSADQGGGGVDIADNTLFAGNLVAHSTGGGIQLDEGSSSAVVADSTIVDNTGGGVVENDFFSGDFSLENTILARNDQDAPADTTVCRLDADIVGTAPTFSDSDYDLAPGSTAIDAGRNGRVPKLLATDAEGNPRIQNGVVDVGYVESAGPSGTGGTASTTPAPCNHMLSDHASTYGTSVTTVDGSGARATDPIETTVTAPTTAFMDVHEFFRPFASGSTIEKFEDVLNVGPGGTSSSPYSVEFDLDKSLAPAGNLVSLSDDGSNVPPCSGAGADPDPCIAGYKTVDDDAHITVRASGPSGKWTFDLAPLANAVPPSITGTPTDGEQLTGHRGVWGGTTPVTFASQWLRCDSAGANCAPITNATHATYRLKSDDVGHTVELQVTGTNSSGSLMVTSPPTAVVAAAPPSNTVAPSITGTAQQGQQLTGHNGTWAGTQPLTFARQWLRCDAAGANCSAISSATSHDYTAKAVDVGKTLEYQVTATNYVDHAEATSPPTAPIASP